jgi:predicted transposase/invertase (TIGR01784 family)
MRETIHDKGYKRLFSNKLIFQQLIKTFVTEDWVKDCDFEHCQKIDKSFISEHYKETESDIIYQVKFKNKNAYIYLLLEFQSSVSWYMALRMLNYVSNFYMDYIETHKRARKLPPIFPLVLYNGDEKWTAATDFRDLLEKPDLLKHYAPQLHYFKIAENEYSTENLLKIKNLVSALFLVEKSKDIELIKFQLESLFDNEDDKQAITVLLNWFKQLGLRGKKSLDDYQEFEYIYQSKEEVKTMLETTLDQYGQTFFVKGKEDGIQKGIQKGKIETLILLLEERFGSLSAEQKEMICQFNEGDFTQTFKKLFSIKSLDEIFTVQ